MARAPNPGFVTPPKSAPVTRWKGPQATPPKILAGPGPFANAKAAMPRVPSAFVLFHKPRNPGHGGG
jgi:hypothetical protein